MKFFVKGFTDVQQSCPARRFILEVPYLVEQLNLGPLSSSADEGVQSRQAWIGNQLAVQLRRVRCLACQWLLAPSLVLYMTTRQRGLSHPLMT